MNQDGNSSPVHVTRRKFSQLIGASSAATFLRRLFWPGALSMETKMFASGSTSYNTADFCLVGDFGAGYFLGNQKIDSQNPNALAVAEGIRKFAPLEGRAYVVSLGDQIYEPYDGSPSPEYPYNDETWLVAGVEAYDRTIGELYAPYIRFPKNSKSTYAAKGASTQRFLAILGDHDWWHQPRTELHNQLSYPLNTASYPAQIAPTQPVYHLYDPSGESVGYTEYFANQGDGSNSESCCYWDLIKGRVHWFALSSDPNEVLLGTLSNGYYSSTLPGGLLPDGLTPGEQNQRHSLQGKWFNKAATTSTSTWKFVATHYPPYSSSSAANGMGGHPSATYMQWDYAGCGIDAVFSGHVHNYERLYKGGVVYVVNGAGGTFKALAGYVNPPLSISQKRITDAYGFMTAHEGKGKITFTYHSVPPQASLPYEKQKYTQSDCFTLLNKGTLTTSVEMERPNSIIVTKGGGTIDLNGFDSSFSNKLQGVGRLIKQGNGTLSFDGKNPDFTGTLQLKKGALRLASEDVLSREVALVGDGGILIVEGGCHSFDTPLELRKSLELDLQAPRLVFGDSSNARWSSSAILWLRGDLSPRSLCFGSHSSGLTRKQLSRIRLKSHPHLRFDRLDEEGYLLSPVSEQAHVPGQGFSTTDIRSLA